ncbi:MAG: LapA family protein [Cellvibrionaceae bacterium]
MTLIKRLLLLLVLLCGLILGVWFSVENAQPVQVTLLGFSLPQLSVGVWLTAVLLLGAVLGYVISVFPVLKLKNENMSLHRKLKRRDRELEKLRKLPVKSASSSKGSSLTSLSE